MKKTVLFVHQSFPGQFHKLAEKLAREGHRVAALALTPTAEVEGVTLVRYGLVRAPQQELPYLLSETDVKILRGESAAAAMRKLRQQGFNPDVVYAHPGWGEVLFVKDVWPDTRLVVYAEWYYNAHGQEVDFDPEFPPFSEADHMRLRLKNTVFLHALNDADQAVSPTEWQKSRFPAWAQEKIQVVHDGLDLHSITLGAPRGVRVPGRGVALKYGDPIVTFVARHLEPVRGFHIFMRALPEVLRRRPDAHVFILGNDAGMGTGYGPQNPLGKTWRRSLEDEVSGRVDFERVHFLGQVDYQAYLSMLRLSACHVYLTTPFILSWSFLEAAALGLPIVASRTAPIMEFAHLHGVELVDFFDHAALSQKMLQVLDEPVLRTPNALKDLDFSVTLEKLTDIVLDEGGQEEDARQEPEPVLEPSSKNKSGTKESITKIVIEDIGEEASDPVKKTPSRSRPSSRSRASGGAAKASSASGSKGAPKKPTSTEQER